MASPLRVRLVLSALSVLAASTLPAAISYPPPTFVTTGSQPTSIVTADFNNDCALDFATANQGGNNVTVAFGNGSGGFPTTTTVSGMANPQAIVTADFNEDGFPDFAVGNNVTFPGDTLGLTLGVFLNDGTGAFTAAAPSPATSGGARWMATGDMNEDGHADLLVSDIFNIVANGVRLYLGDGTGHFAAPTTVSTDTHFPGAVITTDLNNDDNLDIAVVTGDSTALFLGNGNGTFGAPTYHLYPDPIVGADGAVHIAAADIDDDGDMDFATVAGNVVAGATVFKNNGGMSFTRTKFQMPLAPANPIFVALADLDGDGNIDIVSADQFGCTPWGSNLAARPGNGDGTFGGSIPISVGYGPTCVDSHWNPNAIAAADLNCDGAADLITPNVSTSFVSVLLTPGAADSTDPVVTAPAAVTVAAGAGSCSAVITDAQLGDATATDNCSECVSIVRTGVPPGNVFPAGVTIVTYTANDGHGNSDSDTQAVTVTDGGAPAITAPADITVSAGPTCNASVAPGSPAASDDCSAVSVNGVRSDGQPLAAPFPIGTTTITWTATDASSNSASDTQTITVNDATPPSITAPADITVTGGLGCMATVDPGAPAASDSCSAVTVTSTRSDGQALAAPFGEGTTTITWTATDAAGNSSSDTQTITVVAPPVVTGSASASPSSLWPPNHKMETITIGYTIAGGCAGATCVISSVSSNEPINGTGDGDTAPDWEIVDATHVKVRAERSGSGNGRIYTIAITCTDTGGHTATATVTVSVPHSKKK